MRKAIDITQRLVDTNKDLFNLHYELVVDIPNDLIHNFQGAFHVLDKEEMFVEAATGIDLENTMWAQSVLVKGIVYGIVVYSGEDSKLMMSKVKSDPKRSKVDDELNLLSKLLFIIMVGAAGLLIWLKGFQIDAQTTGIQFFRYILLLCSIIPISMKVNQDISKFYFSSRIQSDAQIAGTASRNSMIAEDLGRIEYFLTDKTGTLTQNIMIMKYCGLGEKQLDATDLKDSAKIAKNGAQEGYIPEYSGDM